VSNPLFGDGMKEFRLRLRNIIASMRGRVVTPGDVVALTGLPRFELMNAKGNYRVYRLTDLGEKLLEALDKDYEIGLTVQPPSGGEVEAEA